MNLYNFFYYLFKTYTLYNNIYSNYNLYIISLFLNPCITYFLKQQTRKEKTTIYIIDKQHHQPKLLLDNHIQNNDNVNIEIIDDNDDLNNFTIIEKIEK
jgi:hypothetical protein